MQPVRSHIIHSQVLEVEMHQPQDAFLFRNHLAELFYDNILPAMEQVMNDVGENKTIRIDRVEIDAGELEPSNWELALTGMVSQRLKEALHEFTETSIKTAQPDHSKSLHQSIAEPDARELDNSSITGYEVFIYFLEKGRLPWFSHTAFNIKQFVVDAIKDETVFQQLLAYLPTAGSTAIKRLVMQLESAELEIFLNRLLGRDRWIKFQSIQPYFITILNGLLFKKEELNVLCFLPAFYAFKSNDVQFERHIYYSFLNLLIIEKKHNQAVLLQQVKDLIFGNLNLNQGKILAAVIAEMENGREEIIINENKSPTKRGEELNEALFILNAGLVLIHPFLPALFSRLDLLNDDGQFVDAHAQRKAVWILQYLVEGDTEIDEHLLLLNKILCGMEISEPVERSFFLLDEDIIECENLLQQVCQRWLMKGHPVNVTVNGLRQSFLLREGKITKTPNKFHLLVKQQSYDMVLSSLPWGIGIIKTPWMHSLLYVDWA